LRNVPTKLGPYPIAYVIDAPEIRGKFGVMARTIRIEYPGAIHHVMNRGDRREAIFHSDEDRALFCDALAEACGRTGRRTRGSLPDTQSIINEPDWRSVKHGYGRPARKPAARLRRKMKICEYAGLTPSCLLYYLNPEPNSRNVEFDPNHNLLKNIKEFDEQVHQP